MVKNLKELKKSAGIDFNPDQEGLDLFAELIVKECAEIAGCNSHVSGFALGDLIKQHFELDKTNI
jgi:hypothetical protein